VQRLSVEFLTEHSASLKCLHWMYLNEGFGLKSCFSWKLCIGFIQVTLMKTRLAVAYDCN